MVNRYGWSNEPTFWIGVVMACIVAVIQTLVGKGLVTEDVNQMVVNLFAALSPIITALFARGKP